MLQVATIVEVAAMKIQESQTYRVRDKASSAWNRKSWEGHPDTVLVHRIDNNSYTGGVENHEAAIVHYTWVGARHPWRTKDTGAQFAQKFAPLYEVVAALHGVGDEPIPLEVVATPDGGMAIIPDDKAEAACKCGDDSKESTPVTNYHMETEGFIGDYGKSDFSISIIAIPCPSFPHLSPKFLQVDEETKIEVGAHYESDHYGRVVVTDVEFIFEYYRVRWKQIGSSIITALWVLDDFLRLMKPAAPEK